jgi:hypothetical protein
MYQVLHASYKLPAVERGNIQHFVFISNVMPSSLVLIMFTEAKMV